MAKVSAIESNTSNNIHPDMEDKDYIKKVKIDKGQSYSSDMEKFRTLCKSMNEDELEEKINQLQKALKGVDDSLDIQKFHRSNQQQSNSLRDTAYTKGLLEDQLEYAEEVKKSLVPENKIEEINE
jgi:hypothetical protein